MFRVLEEVKKTSRRVQTHSHVLRLLWLHVGPGAGHKQHDQVAFCSFHLPCALWGAVTSTEKGRQRPNDIDAGLLAFKWGGEVAR